MKFFNRFRNSASSWNKRGISLRKQKKYQEALDSFEEALKIDSNSFDALFHKGITLLLIGKYQEALECYDKTLELDPEYHQPILNKMENLRWPILWKY
ncbi:MAG: tetratricopeptide repeat protein [Methanobacterium formicicum]